MAHYVYCDRDVGGCGNIFLPGAAGDALSAGAMVAAPGGLGRRIVARFNHLPRQNQQS
jgi:hypothetical protein